MSRVGVARWNYFQEHKIWPPSVIEEQLGASDNDSAFDWVLALKNIQQQIKRHPYIWIIRERWDIDRIGAEWHDVYPLTAEYRRSEKIFYCPMPYGSKLPLNDNLLTELLNKWEKFRAESRNYDIASGKLMEWWQQQ